MRILGTLILSVLLPFLITKAVFAASIDISSGPSRLLSSNEEYSVNVVLSINTPDGTPYYLRGVFFKPGDNNYCGYTWNGNFYFKGPISANEGWKNFLKTTVQSSTWSGQLKAKIDPEDSGCQSSGNYYFKIQRFTENGSGSFDKQTEQSVELIIPLPTPTVIPTSSSTPSPRPKPTVTPIVASTPLPTKSSSPQNSPRSTSTPLKSEENLATRSPNILGQIIKNTKAETRDIPASFSAIAPLTASSFISELWQKILLVVSLLVFLGMIVSSFLVRKKEVGF